LSSATRLAAEQEQAEEERKAAEEVEAVKAREQNKVKDKPATTTTPQSTSTSSCDPSYPNYCIPINSPDLDCKDIAAKNITVLAPDGHRLDRDSDGVGCEN
jgi:hypothetical protein